MEMEMTATEHDKQGATTIRTYRFLALLRMARHLQGHRLTDMERHLCLQCYDLGYLRGCMDGASALADRMLKGDTA